MKMLLQPGGGLLKTATSIMKRLLQLSFVTPGLRVVGLASLAVILSYGNCSAALFAYHGFTILNNNAGGNTYYDLDLGTGNPDFAGSTFTIDFGQTLLLGGQVKTDGGGGQPNSWGAEWARLYYQIDGGSFSSLNLPVITGPVGDWFEQFEEANTANMANIASGLGIGNHSLVLFIQAHDNTQPADGYMNNGGANFSATISVVPEPTTIALGVFGAVGGIGGLVRWQVRRKATE